MDIRTDCRPNLKRGRKAVADWSSQRPTIAPAVNVDGKCCPVGVSGSCGAFEDLVLNCALQNSVVIGLGRCTPSSVPRSVCAD